MTNQNLAAQPFRIQSIDLLRGLVMILMALDHTRDFFHITANTDDPLNPNTTTPLLYATRWVTHFCAPVFVFLSGISIYLQSQRKTKAQLSSFLLKRGIWLIVFEILLNTLFWTFDPFYSIVALQVIWAIGFSMIVLSVLIYLPMPVILSIGLAIVLGHNLLDYPEAAPGFQSNVWWDLLHHGGFNYHPITNTRGLIVAYPVLPWIGIMTMGYCAGTWFKMNTSSQQRRKYLLLTGAGMILLFVALRFINHYGDPQPWIGAETVLQSFYSFMNVQKYPPSLMYTCITLGPALLFLAAVEKIRAGRNNPLMVFGSTAFFYYLLHVLLIHLLATIAFFIHGHTMADAIELKQQALFYFVVPGEGFGLAGTYAVWVLVLVLLYPLCRAYGKYKAAHPEKKYLSYL